MKEVRECPICDWKHEAEPPKVPPEALASGLAVLAFEHAAASELIRSGHNGLLAPLGDAGAFVRRAVDMAANPALCQQLAQQARASVITRDWASISTQVESLWARLARQQEHVVVLPAQASLA